MVSTSSSYDKGTTLQVVVAMAIVDAKSPWTSSNPCGKSNRVPNLIFLHGVRKDMFLGGMRIADAREEIIVKSGTSFRHGNRIRTSFNELSGSVYLEGQFATMVGRLKSRRIQKDIRR